MRSSSSSSFAERAVGGAEALVLGEAGLAHRLDEAPNTVSPIAVMWMKLPSPVA